MGMELSVFTKGFSPDLIPQIKKRFSDFNMEIEFHPEFKFDEQADTGFLPIKLKVNSGNSKLYDEIGFDIMTGFELLYSDYDFNEEFKLIQKQVNEAKPKSFLSNLFGKATPIDSSTLFVADKEQDQLLEHCKKNIGIYWKSWYRSELRVSLFFAAILAELTDGVIYDSYNGRYLNGKQALELFPFEIEEYEKTLNVAEFKDDKFVDWI